MTCPRCRTTNRAAAAFCRQCGERLPSACAGCGRALQPGDRFCDGCGAPVAERGPKRSRVAKLRRHFPGNLARKLAGAGPLEGERKAVSVLFCDIANSMALAERLGPEQMHALLNDFFALALTEVHAYEGTINQFLGDGFMALFGAPIAQEEHERLAVLAALGIQRAVARREQDLVERHGAGLLLRVGINTGPVVVGKIGDSTRVDYTAVGDTTNLAARLQQAAEPGTILVSDAVAARVADAVVLEPVGALGIKGKSQPIRAHRVVGRLPHRPGAPEHGRGTLSPFVGREREMAVLHAAFTDAGRGAGRVVTVVGEAGTGKSRLVAEARLATADVTFLEGRCLSYGSLVPYLPFLDILRELCGLAEGDATAVVIERVRATLRDAGVEDGTAAAYLIRLLGIGERDEAIDALSPETIKARTFDVLRRLLVRTTERRPVALVVENAHWIDKISEELLASLVDEIGAARMVVLVTYRPGYRARWLEKPQVTALELAPLGEAQGVAIVRAVPAADTLSAETITRIVQRAEGNPFFLEELARVMAEHRDLRIDIDLPETVHEVLMARIDRLSGDAKRLLQTASVLGRAVPLQLLGEMWEERHGLDRPLRELQRAELLRERTGGDEIVYVFKHALVREAAYASLLAARRQVLHARAAEVLERLYADRLDQVYDRLAFHYARTRAADRAIHYLSRLADRAARWHAHAEAAGALKEALAQVDRLPESAERDRLRVTLALAEAHSLHFLGSFREILELLLPLRAMLDRVGDAALAGEFQVRLGRTYDVIGDHARAVESAAAAIDAAGRCGDDAIAGKAYFVLAYVGYWSGHPREGVAHGRRAVALLEKGTERWWLGQAHWVVAINQIILGELREALAADMRARTVAEEIGDARLQSGVAWSTGAILALMGDWDAAIAEGRRGLELAPDPLGRAVAEGLLGGVYVEKGDHANARPLLESAVRQLEHFGLRQTQGWFLTLLGQAHLFATDLERARELATAGLEMTLAVKHRHGVAWAHRTLARVADASGEPERAEEHYRAALATFVSIDARYEQARTHLEMGEAAAVQGRYDAAREALAETLRLSAGLAFERYADRVARLTRALSVTSADRA
jgi:class 3 adenylate cyclase/tetratricopeptide (TPR) repeat protein